MRRAAGIAGRREESKEGRERGRERGRKGGRKKPKKERGGVDRRVAYLLLG